MNPKIYVVVLEADPLMRALLERWLGDFGYQVADLLPDEPARYSLVIADVADPASAGEQIGALRAYGVPILALSARFRRGLAGSAEAARRLGVARVLPKPFTREELLRAVRESVEGAM